GKNCEALTRISEAPNAGRDPGCKGNALGRRIGHTSRHAMTPRSGIVAAIGLQVFLCCCAPKRVQLQPQAPSNQNLIVLLPDDDGTVGKVTVTNSGVTRELTEAYSGLWVEAPDAAPGTPLQVDRIAVERSFGNSLDILPAPEASFTLYFLLDSVTMTPES